MNGSSASSCDECDTDTAQSAEFGVPCKESSLCSFESLDWCTTAGAAADPDRDEKLRQEEASRLAEQILNIVEIEKTTENAPDGNELTEIRENRDLWHYSPVLGHQSVAAEPLDFGRPETSDVGSAPFAEPVGFQPAHRQQDQIQNAYALTAPLTPMMDTYFSPKVVYEDQTAMVMMVEDLDIAEPAAPPPPPPRTQHMHSSFERRPYAEYGHIPYARYQLHPEQASNVGARPIPRHRAAAEAIRESDIPPRFRKRKAPRDRATSFQPRRAGIKMHSNLQQGHGLGPHGSWHDKPAANEHTSIRQLVMRYSFD